MFLQEWVILNREKVEPLPVSLEATNEAHVVVGVVEPGVVGHFLFLVALPLKDERMEAAEAGQDAGVVHAGLGVSRLVFGQEGKERLRAVRLVAECEGLAWLRMEAAHEAIHSHVEGPLRGDDGQCRRAGVWLGGDHLQCVEGLAHVSGCDFFNIRGRLGVSLRRRAEGVSRGAVSGRHAGGGEGGPGGEARRH